LRTIRDLEHFGATYSTYLSRETLSYHSTSLRTGSPSLNVLVESLACQLSPQLQEWEVMETRAAVRESSSYPENWQNLMEVAHFEAFRDSGLGNPTLCPSFNLDNIDGRHLHSHLQQNFFSPGNLTVVGTGVKHNEFLALVKPLFANPSVQGTYPELSALPPLQVPGATNQSTKWTGGSVSRLPSADDAGVLLAFAGPSFNSREHTVFSVLSNVVSSSGRYSAVHEAYSDAGVFGLYAEGKVAAGQLADELRANVKALAASFTASQLESSQKKLILRYYSILEDPLALSACLARYGPSFLDVENRVKSINSVSLADLQKAASSLSDPVLVASGNVSGL